MLDYILKPLEDDFNHAEYISSNAKYSFIDHIIIGLTYFNHAFFMHTESFVVVEKLGESQCGLKNIFFE